MSKELFQVAAQIQSIRTLVDGGNKLEVVTQEIDPAEMTKVFGLKGKLGWMVFSENEINETDVPEADAPIEKGDKSPSARLRSRMFVYFQNKYKTKKGFDSWYATTLDNIGQTYLEKIDG